jgi:PAS domain S-box-containing protein
MAATGAGIFWSIRYLVYVSAMVRGPVGAGTMRFGELEAPLPALIELSTMAMCVTNPRLHDNPVVACNQAFTDLTGYRIEDIIGQNCRFLSRADPHPEIAQKIGISVREKRGVLFEVVNYKKDGTPFRNAVMVAPMFDENGEVSFFLGSQVEVHEPRLDSVLSERKQAAQQRLEGLTPRQREILELMAAGQLNKQIAFALDLSEKTVKMHRALLLQRLGVATSADAVRLAVEAGF